MLTSLLKDAVLYSGPLADVLLCLILLHRGRLRVFPAFFSFILADLCSSAILIPASLVVSRSVYIDLYIGYDVVSSILQLAVLFEIARNVLSRSGIWHRQVFTPLLLAGAAGAAIAAAISFILKPAGIHGLQAIQLRGEVFMGLLTCELVISMMLSASHVGLPWRSHVMAIGQGLMLWSMIAASAEGWAAYLGPQFSHYSVLYYIRSLIYVGTMSYWCVALWREEPERKPISPALRKYIVALHDQVQYDLGKVRH